MCQVKVSQKLSYGIVATLKVSVYIVYSFCVQLEVKRHHRHAEGECVHCVHCTVWAKAKAEAELQHCCISFSKYVLYC